MKYCRHFILIVLIIGSPGIMAQQAMLNQVDSLGLKKGLWREFKIPYAIISEDIAIKAPEIISEYYYLSKKEDRKYFPIVESIGEYQNGLKTGTWFEYHGNGNIKSQIEYKEGIPYGNCIKYWGNGVIQAEFIINSYDSIPVKMYDKNGDLIEIVMSLKINLIKGIYTD